MPLKLGPSRHRGASYTIATWPLRDRKLAQVAERMEGGEGVVVMVVVVGE